MNIRTATEAAVSPTLARDEVFLRSYLDALHLVERLHRRLLDVIKDELVRLSIEEVNPVQVLLLFNIGKQEVTAGELRSGGYYQGSNVSNNLKKLVEMGYMHQQRSEVDRRCVHVRLTEKGRGLCEIVARLFAIHAEGIATRGILDVNTLDVTSHSLKRLERFWSSQIRHLY